MKKHLLAAAAIIAFAFAGSAAPALDIADVKNLLRNNVDETVIANMVLQGGSLAATTGDIAELRSLGASETLISAIGTVGTYSPGEYILQDGTTAAIPQPGTVYREAPVVVAQPPRVYYETPTVVVPRYVHPYPGRYYYHSRPGFSFSFGFGPGSRRHRP